MGREVLLTRFHPTCQPSAQQLALQLVLADNGCLRGSILCLVWGISGAGSQVVFAVFALRGLAVDGPLSL